MNEEMLSFYMQNQNTEASKETVNIFWDLHIRNHKHFWFVVMLFHPLEIVKHLQFAVFNLVRYMKLIKFNKYFL